MTAHHAMHLMGGKGLEIGLDSSAGTGITTGNRQRRCHGCSRVVWGTLQGRAVGPGLAEDQQVLIGQEFLASE